MFEKKHIIKSFMVTVFKFFLYTYIIWKKKNIYTNIPTICIKTLDKINSLHNYKYISNSFFRISFWFIFIIQNNVKMLTGKYFMHENIQLERNSTDKASSSAQETTKEAPLDTVRCHKGWINQIFCSIQFLFGSR